MILFEFFDPLCVCLLVCIVGKIFVAAFPLALLETVALCVPLVASNQSGRIEGRCVLDDCAGEKLFVNCLAIPIVN